MLINDSRIFGQTFEQIFGQGFDQALRRKKPSIQFTVLRRLKEKKSTKTKPSTNMCSFFLMANFIDGGGCLGDVFYFWKVLVRVLKGLLACVLDRFGRFGEVKRALE